MDGITISVNVSTLGLLIFVVYKLVQIEYRLKMIEAVIYDRCEEEYEERRSV